MKQRKTEAWLVEWPKTRQRAVVQLRVSALNAKANKPDAVITPLVRRDVKAEAVLRAALAAARKEECADPTKCEFQLCKAVHTYRAANKRPLSERTKEIRRQQRGAPTTAAEVVKALNDGTATVVHCPPKRRAKR